MLGTFSNSVSSRVRAVIGKVKTAVARKDSAVEAEPLLEVAKPVARFDDSGYDVHKVETEAHEFVEIKVSKVPDTLYFEEEESYAPTVVQVARAPVSEPVFTEPVRKANVAPADPADLFLNALRRPTRQKFDASAPRIKRKSVEDVPVAEAVVDVPSEVPAVEAAEPVSVEVPAEIVVEPVEPQAVTFEVTEDAVSIVTEVPVAEAVVDVPSEVPAVEAAEPVVSEVSDVAIPEIVSVEEAEETVPVETEVPVNAPIVVVPALPMKIEVPELVKEESEESFFSENVASADCVLTSSDGAVMETVVEVPEVFVEEKVLAPVILNEDRDVLMLFRSELEEEEQTLTLTSMDNNSDLPEDRLDETELTFKIRVPRNYSGFTGHFRPVGFY